MADPTVAREFELQSLISDAVTDREDDDAEVQFAATRGLAQLLASYERRIAELEAQLASK